MLLFQAIANTNRYLKNILLCSQAFSSWEDYRDEDENIVPK